MLSPQADTLIRDFFERQALAWVDRYYTPSYQQRRQLVTDILGKEVLKLDRQASKIKLLDFGCGSGVFLGVAASLGLQVTGVDNSKAMIEAALRQVSRFGKQVSLECLHGDSGKGDYERESYDIVLCLSVIEFVADISSLLFRLCARVNKGGILVLSVPNRQSWLRAIEHFVYRHPQKFRQFSALDHLTGSDSYLNYQAHQFTRKQLSGMVQQNGLREEAHRFHAAPAPFRSIDHLAPMGMMLMMTFRK